MKPVIRHSRAGGNPVQRPATVWIPAFAGMTALLLGFVLPIFAAEAPKAFLRSEVTPTEIHVGDRIAMAITVTYEAPLKPAAPNFGGAAGDFEILSVTPEGPRPAGANKETLTYRLSLTTFSTGTIKIPALPVYFNNPDGSFLEARTDEVPITVKSLLAEKGDQGGLRPAKGLYNVRSLLWLWILLGALLVGLAIWAASHFRKKGGPLAAIRQEPLLSPEDEALQALEKLQAEPVTEETMKEYYFRLSVILRRYIERRYAINALEMTTSELISSFRRMDLPMSASLSCREFLDNADLVKFAKMTPNPEEVPVDVTRVRVFIEETTPKPVEPTPEEKAAGEIPPV